MRTSTCLSKDLEVLQPLCRTIRCITAGRVCWRCKCVKWGRDGSSGHITAFQCSWVQICTPHIRGWISKRAYQAQSRGPRGQGESYKQNLCVKWLISHCTVKWAKVLLANRRNDLNIHFEVVTRKKPSGHLQRECLSPQVSCWTFRTSADIMRYVSFKSAGRNQKCDHTAAAERGFLGIPSHRIIHAHIEICVWEEEDSKSWGGVSIWVSVLELHRSSKKWGNGGKLQEQEMYKSASWNNCEC